MCVLSKKHTDDIINFILLISYRFYFINFLNYCILIFFNIFIFKRLRIIIPTCVRYEHFVRMQLNCILSTCVHIFLPCFRNMGFYCITNVNWTPMFITCTSGFYGLRNELKHISASLSIISPILRFPKHFHISLYLICGRVVTICRHSCMFSIRESTNPYGQSTRISAFCVVRDRITIY